MRESSGEKYEVIRDIHKIDPSHIENGESVPTLKTIVSYCNLFGRCPGWVFLLSCQVDKGKISEKDFEKLVLNWNDYSDLAEWKIDEFLKMAVARSH
jgi:DNA-binding XRE family transcriptional regulator